MDIKEAFLTALAGAHIIAAAAVPHMPEDVVDSINKSYDVYNGETSSFSENVEMPSMRDKLAGIVDQRDLDQIDAKFVSGDSGEREYILPGKTEDEIKSEDMERDMEAVDNLMETADDVKPEPSWEEDEKKEEAEALDIASRPALYSDTPPETDDEEIM